MKSVDATYSSVILGRDKLTLQAFAVKVVVLEGVGAQLFQSEVEVLSALPTHRNLPHFFGATVSAETGCGYIVLECVSFPPLCDVLHAHGAMTCEEAVYVLGQLIDSLNVLQYYGFAHRDIKTSNILVNPHTFAMKLIDFGLATPVDDDFTRDSRAVGTLRYMAPEVLRGRYEFDVQASDMWSVGVVFWEMLQGENPFAQCRNSQRLLAAQRDKLAISDYPASVTALLRGLLALDPRRRMLLGTARQYIHRISPPSPIQLRKKHFRSSSEPLL